MKNKIFYLGLFLLLFLFLAITIPLYGAAPLGNSDANLTILTAFTNNIAFIQADIDAINATGGTTFGLNKNEHWDINFSSVATQAIYNVSIKYYVSGTTSGPWSISATNGRDGTTFCSKTGEQGASITTEQTLLCPAVDTQAKLDNLWVLMTGETDKNPETITVDRVYVYVDYDLPVDPCACPGLNQNWQINMSNSCVIGTNCNLGTGNITFVGTGTTTFNATISSKNLKYPVTGQTLYIGQNSYVNIG